MEVSIEYLQYILALAAVINGLGITRLLSGAADYLRRHKSLKIRHYSVYTMLLLFQLLVHLLFWWTAIGLRSAADLNFITYLYLLTGPTLLYLGTSLILPDLSAESNDMRTIYFDFRKTYFTILAVFLLWSIFLWPVFGFSFSKNLPLVIATLVIALILRLTANPKIHLALMITNLTIYVLVIALFAMHVGGVTHFMLHR